MNEEKKEKPDWLSDFQNAQATGEKQTCSEEESYRNNLEIYGPVTKYASPRYGRRSITGPKSVENSPTKIHGQENKVNNNRSISARPVLQNFNIFPSKSDSVIEEGQDAYTFVYSLQVLQNDLENFSFSDIPKSRRKLSSLKAENLINRSKNYENLEDSWNSLSIFNIKQKGRLGPTEKSSFLKINESEYPRGIIQRQETANEINDKVHQTCLARTCTVNENPDDVKLKKKVDGWGDTKRVYENINETSVQKNYERDFIVPELPQGKLLVLNIRTTWGDKHYLGLNGIEIFNSKGKKVQVKSIAADPPNINILPEYSNDPRVVENLIDNIYLTQDDMHMWLAPYSQNSSHFIFIEFKEVEELAMLRIWNYNKSRIHCFRGAKDIEIKLDDKFIFIGEIARASGEILNPLNCLGDTILFTTNEDILESVAENDEFFNINLWGHLDSDNTKQEELRPLTGRDMESQIRPFTGPKIDFSALHDFTVKYNLDELGEKQKKITDQNFSPGENLDSAIILDRGLKKSSLSNEEKKGSGSCDKDNFKHFLDGTEASGIKENVGNKNNTFDVKDSSKGKPDLFLSSGKYDTLFQMKSNENLEDFLTDGKAEDLDKSCTLYIPSASYLAPDSPYETPSMPTGYNFTVQIHSTWGDSYYVGLNGIQIYDENRVEIKMNVNNIRADPESVNVLEGIDNDSRTPDKLIDGVNETTDGCHMWLAPVLPLTINRIDLVFEKPVTLSVIKLWNYAKTPSRGVREFGILVDGLLIYNGELEQAIVMPDGAVPRVPCKTVSFSNSSRIQRNSDYLNQIGETSSSMPHSVDQTKRPLTTMTSHS